AANGHFDFFEDVFTDGKGRRPYWIGIEYLDDKWMIPTQDKDVAERHDYQIFTYNSVTYTRWRPSQPDGCCGRNVICAAADYQSRLGLWDDISCDENLPGVVCQRFAFQPV
ncbi:unnamed protein product, partial [Gongylonema pulchrum]|uniref:C-type lectin domain-containing protein n=1 Tax=Gongylonema pulchrum TaxID=637853 RepID=A0A183D402_9BILA